MMDHATIEADNIVERYCLRTLAADLEMRFEAHFVDCAQCLVQLELERGFQQGVRTVGAQDAARAQIAAAAAITAIGWRWRRLWASLLVALLAVGASAWWFGQDSTPTDRHPTSTAPIVLLSTVRGDQPPPAVETDAEQILAVQIFDDPRFISYRLTIFAAASGPADDGPTLWQASDQRPNALETLMVTLPADTLAAGDYRLRLEGEAPSGQRAEIAVYRFEITGSS